MPRMYHPERKEVVVKGGKEVKVYKDVGFIVVGNRPEEEYMGKTREELLGPEDDETEEEESEEETEEETEEDEEDATPEV